MTECPFMTTGADPEEGYIPGNNGRVVTGYDVKFADLTTGEAVGPNIEGEICVKGNKMFCGYLRGGVVSSMVLIARDGIEAVISDIMTKRDAYLLRIDSKK